MTTSKILALGALLLCQLTLARVQINSILVINQANVPYEQTAFHEIQLDPLESAIIFEEDGLRIEARLLEEQDNLALVCFSIYKRNDQGILELLNEPTLCVAYGDTGTIAFGQTRATGELVDSLTITLNPTK